MPYEIVRNDITNMKVDAIVNTASPKPLIGFGVDSGIHKKAGPKLLAARKAVGKLAVGQAAITPGFDLPAKYVIHTATPVWRGGSCGEEALLRRCYLESLNLAHRHGLGSIAFPLMSAGNHGFPKQLALQVAMNAVSTFLMDNEMQVYLVVFSRDAFRLSEKLFQSVASYIDENYITQKNLEEYGVSDKCLVREQQQQAVLEAQMLRQREILQEEPREYAPAPPEGSLPAPPSKRTTSLPFRKEKKAPLPLSQAAPVPPAPLYCATIPVEAPGFGAGKAKPSASSLKNLLEETDAGFSETLLTLIDRTGKKDSEIYTRANVSRQHFSKIRNNPDYKPTKPTAIAFAIALELDMEQTRDLIGRAGYALTRSSKFDLIIMYFINNRNYNMFDINAALFEFDQSLLGA